MSKLKKRQQGIEYYSKPVQLYNLAVRTTELQIFGKMILEGEQTV
jgi:hypothetical protein